MLRIWIRYIAYLIVAIGVSVANANSYDAWFRAVKQDDAGSIEALIRLGFDPNTPAADGDSGLYIALREPSPRVAQVLIQSPKTNLDQRNRTDETALMMAALKGHAELAQALIDRGADVNKPGWAPLHYAATSGHVALIRLLLDAHAYIDAESPNGTTPLMMAAHYGTVAAVQALLEAGADADVRNQLGLSAQDFAMRAGRKDVFEMIAAHIRRRDARGTW